MRLIDADALRESIITRQTEMSYEDAWALTCVDNAPTIEPQKWVSCSKRLPEIGEYVLCSQDNGDVGEGKLIDSGSWLICYDQICHGSYWVNAWIPLPEPWKEEEE